MDSGTEARDVGPVKLEPHLLQLQTTSKQLQCLEVVTPQASNVEVSITYRYRTSEPTTLS